MSKNKNHFAEKRVATFNSLDTEPKEWKHATVDKFTPFFHRSRNSEKMYEKWIPSYNIPKGFKNPYLDTDFEISAWKKCQLCDTNIIDYGIILHPKLKLYLIVGMECYEKYEDDSTRNLKLHLLTENKKEFFTKLMTSEKKKITDLLTKYIADNKLTNYNVSRNINYNFYSNIIRDRWYDWSKTKFTNFIVKHVKDLLKIGYNNPEEKLSLKAYHKFFKDGAVGKVRGTLFLYCRDELSPKLGIEKDNRYNYYRYDSFNQNSIVLKKDNEKTFSDFIFGIVRKVVNLGIENHKKIIGEGFVAGNYVKPTQWVKKDQ